MTFTREINRLLYGVIIVFFMIVASAGYWAVVGADSILLREDNPRVVEEEAAIRRGAIYSRNDRLLAQTVVNADQRLQRVYDYPATYSVLGYFSLRYGVGGIEAAFDDYLRGDAITDELDVLVQQDLLHLPQQGADIRLTLDLDVQQALADLMQGQRGAGVVISVPDGAVLGLVSYPTYDPNTLDQDWETLTVAEGNPFFNRVTQGQYQPGGMLQTPLMVAGILTNQPFDIVTADANRPVEVDDRTLTCAEEPSQNDLTYTQSYAYGCPFPFSLLAQDINPESLSNIFEAFQLDTPVIIEGYDIVETLADAESTPEPTPQLTLVEEIIGQGDLTINPLGMATLAGAVINNGNAPQPYILSDYSVDPLQWIRINHTSSSFPIMTVNAAQRLRSLMIGNVNQEGASVLANSDDNLLTIGGHTALAISGDETHTWFIGFATFGENRGVAIAIVLEDTDTALLSAQIAGDVLEVAANRLQQ